MSKKTDDIADLYKQYLMPTYAPAVALVSGTGSKVVDIDSKPGYQEPGRSSGVPRQYHAGRHRR